MDKLLLLHPVVVIKKDTTLNKYWETEQNGSFCNNDKQKLKISQSTHDCTDVQEISYEKRPTNSSQRRHSRRAPLVCKECNKTFLLPVNYKVHMESHEAYDSPIVHKQDTDIAEEVVEVDVSKETSTQIERASSRKQVHPSNLDQTARLYEVESKSGKLTTTCSICKKTLCDGSLHRHMMAHSIVKPFECAVCGLSFSSKYSSVQHMTIHPSDEVKENYRLCQICGKHFPEICFHIHMKYHQETASKNQETASKRVFCKICGMSLSTKRGLTAHIRLHIEDKPYSCEVCGKKYLYKSAVRKHMKFHLGIKENECQTCGKKFTRRADLRRHSVIHLRGIDKSLLVKKKYKYQCPQCHIVVSSPTNLYRHMRRVHLKAKK